MVGTEGVLHVGMKEEPGGLQRHQKHSPWKSRYSRNFNIGGVAAVLLHRASTLLGGSVTSPRPAQSLIVCVLVNVTCTVSRSDAWLANPAYGATNGFCRQRAPSVSATISRKHHEGGKDVRR